MPTPGCRSIKSTKRTSVSPVIRLSASSMTMERRRGPEDGRDPAEGGAEEGRDRDLEPGASLVGQDAHHELARDDGRDEHEEPEQEPAPERDARPWKPPAHPVEQAAVERLVGRGGRRRLAAPAAEETAQDAALDRPRDHRPAAELGHRAERAVPGGGPRRPARAIAS